MNRKTAHLLVCILLLMSQIASAQIFHENFETADSVSYYSNGSSTWASNNRLATSGVICDSAAILNPGDLLIMTTQPFSTLGVDSVYLYFNHIAKIEFFDRAIIEVSPDGGVTWIQLFYEFGNPGGMNNCLYYGASNFALQGAKFSEASYGPWLPGAIATPQPNWWRREIFDISTLLGNRPNAQIRFVLFDLNSSGSNGRNGWFIDDISVTDSLDTFLYPFLNIVSGKVFLDLNSDLIQDPGEPPIVFKKVREIGAEYYSYTHNSGSYEVHTLSVGNIDFQLDSSITYSPLFNVVPNTHTVSFSSVGQLDSLNDFAVQPSLVANDLQLYIGSIIPRSNFSAHANQWIMVYNRGSSILVPEIIYYPDPILSYDSASVSPTFITGDSIGWSIGPLYPFQWKGVYVMMNKPPGVAPGTHIITSAKAEPLIGDISVTNNIDTDTTIVTSAFDPNMIEVNHTILSPADLASSEYLEYVIYFQNTGNDTAFYVRVDNLILPELELGSFELIATSHNMEIDYNYFVNPRLLSFEFNNILLPDSGTNEAESHGFIRYRIRPEASLNVGDSIFNQVDIFFDFNPGITTNEAITVIADPTAVINIDFIKDDFKLFPNPSWGVINVETELIENASVVLEIYNIYGQHVRYLHQGMKDPGKYLWSFDITDLDSGIYVLRMTKDDRQTVKKIILTSGKD